MVTQRPLPGFPKDISVPEVSGPDSSPADASTNETEPEQSYPLSSHLPWPPPQMYGVRAMPLPASMICLTASGASSGGSATPLPRAIACETAFEPPDALYLPCTALDAGVDGASPASFKPGSGATASAEVVGSPATGWTALADDCAGSGGSSTCSFGALATTGDAGAASLPAAFSANQPAVSTARPAKSALR